MTEVEKYEENGWFLTHSWYLDDWGLKKNVFEISHIEENGMKMIYPFIGRLRVQNYKREDAVAGDDVSPYEGFEYADMLREQVDKITRLPNSNKK